MGIIGGSQKITGEFHLNGLRWPRVYYRSRDSIEDIYDSFINSLPADLCDVNNLYFSCVIITADQTFLIPKTRWNQQIASIEGSYTNDITVIFSVDAQFQGHMYSRCILFNFLDRLSRLSNTTSDFSDFSGEENFELQSGIIYHIGSRYFNRNHAYFEKLLEDILVLLNGLRRFYNNPLDKTIIIEYIIIFLKLRNNVSLISLLYNSGIGDYIESIISEYSNLKIQSLSLQKAKDVIQSVRSVRNSELSKVIYRLAMFSLTLSLFDSVGLSFSTLGYSHFEAELLRKKFRFRPDIGLDMAEGLIFLLEKGYQIIVNKEVDCLFHNPSEYSDVYDTILDLKQKQHALCNPKAFGFTETWYIKTLDDTIDKVKSIVKYAYKLDSSELRVLKSHLNDLQLIKINNVIANAAQETREVPFSLLFFAQPGVGKSSLVKIAFQHFGATHGLETDDCYLYTRNPAANFADGFSQRHWCWLSDDIAFKKVTANPTGDPTTDELIQLINAVPFVPDQAAIENKGKIPAKPKLVMGTTNLKHVNAFHYFSCPSALQRRFPYVVTVTVKPEFRKEDSDMLDSSKAYHEPDSYPDYWQFDVAKVIVPKNLREVAKYESILLTDSVDKFCSWLSLASLQHFEEQRKMTDSLKQIKSIPICKICYRNKHKCICSLQSGRVPWFRNMYFLFCETIAWVLFFLLKIICFFVFEKIYIFVRSYLDEFLLKFRMISIKERLNKLIFVDLSKQVQANLGLPKLFTGLVAVITSGYTAYKLATFFGSSRNMNLQSAEERDPKPLLNERYNPWVVNDYKLMNMDLTPPILSSTQFSDDEFIDMISHNISSAQIFDLHEPTRRWLNTILCVKGNLYITNAHYFTQLDNIHDEFGIEILSGPKTEAVSPKITLTIKKSSLKMVEECDLCLFILPGAIPKKDITNLFPSKDVCFKSTGSLLTRMMSGELRSLKVLNTHIYHSTQSFDNTKFNNKVSLGKCEMETVKGDCGSPLIVHSPKGHFIISIHRAGNNAGSVLGTCIFRECLLDFLGGVDDMFLTPSGPPNLEEKHFELQTLHSKSVFNFIEGGSGEVYGSLGGFKRTYVSKVKRSLMFDFLKNHNYDENYTKPNLKGWKPWSMGAKDLVTPIYKFDEQKLHDITHHFIDRLLCKIPTTVISSLVEKYTQKVAINGYPGVAYVDKINRNTSTGYPFYTTKRKHIVTLEPDDLYMDGVEVTPEIQARIDHIEAQYRLGCSVSPIFVASLKDEPITFEKAEISKIRVFGCAPMDWTIVVRKYLLSSIRLIQNYKLVFETAIGTVAQSGEWTTLYKYLTKFGDRNMVAGDFKKYDKKMSPVFIRYAFEILYALCEQSGNYDDQDLKVIRCIAIDTAYPLMDYNNDLVRFFGSNPSGHSLTVIINSLVNSLYMRYVFCDLYVEQYGESDITNILDVFDEKVRLLSYGDDNVLGVSDDLSWYNHTSISTAFSKIGIDYTMADKTSESVRYIPMSQVSFLKRTWVFSDELNFHLAPLSHDSIEKMLMTWVKSDTLDANSQCLAVVSSAIREYFFYGPVIFEEKRSLFVKLLHHLDLQTCMSDVVLPTYELLVDQFIENTDRVLGGGAAYDTNTLEVYDNEFYLQSGLIDDRANLEYRIEDYVPLEYIEIVQTICIFLYIFVYFFLMYIILGPLVHTLINLWLGRDRILFFGRVFINRLFRLPTFRIYFLRC